MQRNPLSARPLDADLRRDLKREAKLRYKDRAVVLVLPKVSYPGARGITVREETVRKVRGHRARHAVVDVVLVETVVRKTELMNGQTLVLWCEFPVLPVRPDDTARALVIEHNASGLYPVPEHYVREVR